MSTIMWSVAAVIAAAGGVLGIAICKVAQRADRIMEQQHRAELERLHAERRKDGAP